MNYRLAIKSTVNEIKLYNLYETFLFLLYQKNHDEAMYTRQLSYRKKKYLKNSDDANLGLTKKIFYSVMNKELNIEKPKSFSEKIQWIKHYGISDLMTALVDKYKVREWVSDKIGKKYLIPLLGVWDKYDDVNFDMLPDKFVLKTNHGSSMNYVVTSKTDADYNDMRSKFSAWMNRPFEMVAYEMQYRDVPRKIIAEQYIEEMDGNLFDYKIHCFNGEPKFIQCIGERDVVNHTAYHDHFDLAWNRLDWNFECFPRFPYEVKRPSQLDEMIDISRKLAEGFNYVRVDLYEINGRVYFGEMTFTPGSGMYPYKDTWNYEKDCEVGALINLEL